MEALKKISRIPGPKNDSYHTATVTITPEFAQWALGTSEGNRSVNKSKMAAYARQMIAGAFIEECPNGISFKTGPHLIDGHTRLKAVMESGCSIKMRVSWNTPKGTIPAIDFDGTQRKPSHIAQILHGIECTDGDVAALRVMVFGFHHQGQPRRAQLEVVAVLPEYLEALIFARSAFSGRKRGITTAPVIAVVARAWYTADRDRLSEFAQVLEMGFPVSNNQEDDFAAIVLRDFLFGIHNTSGSIWRKEVYQKTERALFYFLNHKPVKKLSKEKKEIFLLPGEDGVDDE